MERQAGRIEVGRGFLMKFIKLGQSNLEVSRLCLGCMNFGFPASETDSARIIDRAFEGGINFLDTASAYNEGRSEEIVGRTLKSARRRSRVIVATKVLAPMYHRNPERQRDGRRHIVSECEGSLRRLQTDYIDLYQINWPQSGAPLDAALEALDALVRSGKVREAGFTTIAAWQVIESLWIASDHGFRRIVSVQAPYNLLDRRIERELIPMAQARNVALLSWAPVAGGFLSGKYQRGMPRPEGSRWAEGAPWQQSGEIHFIEAAFHVLDMVQAVARELHSAPAQVSVAWCLRQPSIASTIIGPRTAEQLEGYLDALALELPADAVKKLDHIAPPGGHTVPYHIADLGPGKFLW